MLKSLKIATLPGTCGKSECLVEMSGKPYSEGKWPVFEELIFGTSTYSFSFIHFVALAFFRMKGTDNGISDRVADCSSVLSSLSWKLSKLFHSTNARGWGLVLQRFCLADPELGAV